MLANNEFTKKVKEKPYVIEQMTKILNTPEFTNLRADLEKEKKKSIIITLVVDSIIAVVVGVVIGIIFSSILQGLGVGAVLFLFGLIFILMAKKKAQNKYIKAIAPQVIKGIYGQDAVYKQAGGYSREYLQGLNCFPVRTLHQEDYIQGHYCSIPFTIADVESYHYETRGSGKNKTQEKVTDFYGSVMSFKMNKPSKAVIKVTEGISLFKGKTIDFESSAFNKKFNVYSEDRENAFYIITPQLQLAMLSIEKALPGGLVYLFRGEELVIVISGNTTEFKGFDFKKDDNYNINVILDSILAPAYIVEEMNLDHKFFLTEEDIKKEETKQDEKTQDEEDKKDILKGVSQIDGEKPLTDEDINKIKESIDKNK